MAQTRFHHVSTEGEIRTTETVDAALASCKAGGYAWLDFVDPDAAALNALVGPLGINRLSVEDCLDEDQVPKIENFDRSTFALFNAYFYEDGKLVVDEIDFMIGKGFLVTVRTRGGRSSWSSESVETMAKGEAGVIKQGPEFLLHLLLDYTVDDKFKAIETLEAEVESLEAGMMRRGEEFKLGRLVHLRNNLLSLRKSLFHEREILVKICRRDSPFIGEQAIFHFRDVYDHLTKLFEEVELYREMLMNIAELHLSMVNNRMAEMANKTNVSVRRLTLITTIFMPLSFFAGVGGMSEFTMMTGPANWRLAYPAFLAAMVMLGLASYLILLRVEKD